jgi:hypothetical protein
MRLPVYIGAVALLAAVACPPFAGSEEERVVTKDTLHLVTDLTVGPKVKTNPAWLRKPLSVVVDGLKIKQIVFLDDSGSTAPQVVLTVAIQRLIAHAAKVQLEQKPCDLQSGLDVMIVSEDNAYYRIQLTGKWGCITSTDGTGWFRRRPVDKNPSNQDARAPALLDEAQATLAAQQYLGAQDLDWGDPIEIGPLTNVAFRLFYATSDGEKQRLGPRVLGVHRISKTVWQCERR